METLLFLIIVGILSSIFGKGRGKKNPGRGGFEEIRKLIDKQLGIEKQSAPRKVLSAAELPSIEEKYLQINQGQENLDVPPNPTFTRVKEAVEVQMPQVIEEDPKIDEVNPQTVLNGLIWAEVLGEPRARNPYFSRKG